jgi:prephenate dehydratase
MTIIAYEYLDQTNAHAARTASGARRPNPAEPFIALETLDRVEATCVATLGPAGTSSEKAAAYLWPRLPQACAEPRLALYDQYEDAADALRKGEASHFVVANAYNAVNEFYMDTRVALAAVFYMETPLYGIARDVGHLVPERPTVASHPAPVPLVGQLLPAPYEPGEISLVPSTSAAARAARERRVDLALTTEQAADNYGLEFISRTRTIQMVWSVFVADAGN